MKRPRLIGAQDQITDAAVEGSATSVLPTGSLLFVTRSGILSHTLPVAVNDVPVAINQDIKAVVPNEAVLAPYAALAASCFAREILTVCKKAGTTVPSIEFSELKAFKFPLPPLAEQGRIVAKIEELFGELEAGEASLRRARRGLALYRQSLLKQAFEGKLTAPWRAQNPDQLESPDQLLQRIEQERQALYEAHLREWEAAVEEWETCGKEGMKPSKPKKPSNVGALSDEAVLVVRGDVPDWLWAPLELMTLGVEYGSAAKSKKSGECPVLRMGNIQRGEIDWTDLVFTSDELEIEKYRLNAGDVLFNRTNSPEHVGKSAFYRGGQPAVFAGYLIRINQIPSIVEGGFLNCFLSSGIARDYGNRVKTDGVNQSNINGKKLCSYPFPFCSLPEQREIVRLLDEQFEVIEQNEREIDAALKRSEALRQSILQKAFRGELVPQDPDDEPASELLARIRAAREAAAGEAKAKKKAAKKKTPRKKRPKKKSAAETPPTGAADQGTLFDL